MKYVVKCDGKYLTKVTKNRDGIINQYDWGSKSNAIVFDRKLEAQLRADRINGADIERFT